MNHDDDNEILVLLEESGTDRRALGERLMRERDPLDQKLRREAAEARLLRLEEAAREPPGSACAALPGGWSRILFVVQERDRFIGHQYGGGEVWTRTTGELDYFLAAPLGVHRLSRDDAIGLLEKEVRQ